MVKPSSFSSIDNDEIGKKLELGGIIGLPINIGIVFSYRFGFIFSVFHNIM
jgi:hypothetical protein